MYCILFVCQIAFNEWNEKLHKQGTKYLKSFNEQQPSFVLFVEYNLSNNERFSIYSIDIFHGKYICLRPSLK